MMPNDINDANSQTGAPEGELTESLFLEAYKKKEYQKPSLTADIVVFRRSTAGTEVLLIRRGKHPFLNCWALPGGFANPNEDVIDAAQRELEEETGIAGVSMELFGVYGAPGRDPRGWTVSGGFCTLLDSDIKVRAGDDAADARWCPVNRTLYNQPLEKADDSFHQGDTSQKNSYNAYEISVKCSPEEALFVRFELIPQRFGTPRAQVIDSYGFAFDHAQILADAYLKVMQEIELC